MVPLRDSSVHMTIIFQEYAVLMNKIQNRLLNDYLNPSISQNRNQCKGKMGGTKAFIRMSGVSIPSSTFICVDF